MINEDQNKSDEIEARKKIKTRHTGVQNII